MKTIIALCCLSLMWSCASSTQENPSNARTNARSGRFAVRHELKVTVPEGAQSVQVWMPIPVTDAHQEISNLKVDAPVPHRFGNDSEGNQVLHLEATNLTTKELVIVNTFDIERWEAKSGVNASKARPLSASEQADLARYLAPNQHVIIDDRIQRLGREIVASETNSVNAARRIYDWELQNIQYWVKDPKNLKASPVGSTEHCLTTKTGNCTDFHSLFASLARSERIPTRIIYGVFLKKELDGQDIDSSYHCWPEFYVGGQGWVPHDVAVADIYADTFPVNADNETMVRRTTADGYTGPDRAKVDYYFGNLDERRVVFSTGRDLTLNPPAAAGPINALAKAYIEVDGKPHPEKTGWVRKLTYRDLP